MKEKNNFKRRGLLAGFLALVLILSAIPASAYLSGTYRIFGRANIGINLMFDNLSTEGLKAYREANGIAEPEAGTEDEFYKWGHKGNPYVISHPQHLQNLFRLQNSGTLNGIFSNCKTDKVPSFVISTQDYEPATVGNVTIEPVGNESYPFYGTLSGVVGQETPLGNTGKTTTTSAIHNVTVTAADGTPDIGFFGHVTCIGTPPGSYTPSKISNLVFSDVQISVKQTMKAKIHKWFRDVLGKDTPDPKETNHLGIIAGHVTYSTMENLSVYYSSTSVNAVTLSSPESMNYLCGTGFFGLLDHLNPNAPESDGGYNNEDFGAAGSDGGGTDHGNNPGYIRPEELFKLGTGGEDGEVLLTEIPDILDKSEDTPAKNIIYDGVFAFAPSSDNDSIKDIWTPEAAAPAPMLYWNDQSSWDTTGTEENLPAETEPGTTEPGVMPQEKEVKVIFFKNPEDLKLTVWRMVEGKKEYQVSIQDMEELIMTTQEPTQEQIAKHLNLEEGSLVRQAQTDPEQPNLYLLPPDTYFLDAEREGYLSLKEQRFTVDPRSDSMKIQLNLEPLEETPEDPTTEPTQEPTAEPTQEPTTEPTQEPSTEPTQAPTQAPTQDPEETPVESTGGAAVQGEGVVRFVSTERVLPDLYFGNEDSIRLYSAGYESPVLLSQKTPSEGETTAPEIPEAKPVPAPSNGGAKPQAPKAQQIFKVLVPNGYNNGKLEVRVWKEGQPDQLIQHIEKEPNANVKRWEYTLEAVSKYRYSVIYDGYLMLENPVGKNNGQVNLGTLLKKVTFQCKEKNAVVEVTENGASVPRFAAPNVFLLKAKTAYTYSVSCPGFETLSGQSVTVNDKPLTVTVPALQPAIQKGSVTFLCTPADLTLKIWKTADTGKTPLLPVGGQGYQYELEPDTEYTYTAEKTGYTAASGKVQTANGEKKEIPVTLSAEPTPVEKKTVSFVFTPEIPGDLDFKLYAAENSQTPVAPESGYTYQLAYGDYVYTAKAGGYQPLENQSLTVDENTGAEIQVKLTADQPSQSCTVSFQLQANGNQDKLNTVKIRVCAVDHPESVIAPQQGHTYQLTPGEYQFSAMSGYFMPIVNQPFTVNGDQTVPVNLQVPRAGNENLIFHVSDPNIRITLYWHNWNTQKKDVEATFPKTGGDGFNPYGHQFAHSGGQYFYTAEGPGYLTQEMVQINIKGGGVTEVRIELQKIQSAVFQCVPDNMSLKVWSLAGGKKTECQPREGQKYVYDLLDGEYVYTAEAYGYQPSGEVPFTVSQGVNLTIPVQLKELPRAETIVSFTGVPNGMKVKVWSGDPKNPQYYEPTGSNTFKLLTGEYFYTLQEGQTVISKGVPLRLGYEGGKMTIAVPNIREFTFHFQTPGKLDTFSVWRESKGERIAYSPVKQTASSQTFKLPSEPGNPDYQYYYEAKAMGYISKKREKVNITQSNSTNVVLEKITGGGDYPVPPEGLVPPMNAPEGTGGVDTLQLIPITSECQWVSGATEGDYCVYLQKLNGPEDIRLDHPNARYLIAPAGYEGLIPENKAAYLGLRASETEAMNNFQAINPGDATFIDGSKWNHFPEEFNNPPYGAGKKPSMVMTFKSAQERKQALESMALQLEKVGGGKYNLAQSERIDSGGNFYLGTWRDAGWNLHPIRSLEKAPVGGQTFDPGIFDLELIASNGAFTIRLSSESDRLLYHQQSTSTDKAKPNDFLFGYGGGEINTYHIYQIVGYDFVSASEGADQDKGRVVPKSDEYVLEFKADQYFLWRDPEKLTDQHRGASEDPYEVEYELKSIDDLGWNLRSGQAMTSQNYQPTQMFNVQSSPLADDTWTGGIDGGNAVHIKLYKQLVFKIPRGTLSFFVTEEKPDSYVRILAKVPTVAKRYVPGAKQSISRLGIWQINNPGYKNNEPNMSVPMPLSQPLGKDGVGHFIKVKYKNPGIINPANPPDQEGYTHYKVYLQGESVLCAAEFTLNNIFLLYNKVDGCGSMPGPFFLTQSGQPMQFAYCAAEGVANGKPDIISGGNGPMELGNVDFVYDDGKTVTTVTDHEGTGASIYKRSDVLFQFMNIEGGGKTGYTYHPVNQGFASIYRQYLSGGPVITLTKGGGDAAYMKINPAGKNPDTIKP